MGVAEGDFDRPESYKPALQGCERMFLLTPPHPDQTARETALVDAAAAAGVQHVVALSVMGADAQAPISFARWHAAIDEHLAASGLGSTILRSAGFMQVHLLPPTAATEGRWYGMTGNGAHAFVDVRDVAEVAATVLAAEDPEPGVLEVTGPVAISMPEAARVYGQVIGRMVEYIDLPADQYARALTGAGLPDYTVEGIVGLYEVIRAGHAATATGTVAQVTSHAATSYRQFLERQGEAPVF